jgi:hypothetical protein
MLAAMAETLGRLQAFDVGAIDVIPKRYRLVDANKYAAPSSAVRQ